MRTVKQIHEDLVSKKITVRELVDQSLEIIKSNERKFNKEVSEEKDLNAVIDFYSASFINEQIDKAQSLIDEGKGGLWTGVPILVKDNILVAGEKVSAGSKMLENYVATYDASIIEKLKENGVILLGRTNMDEFAMGSSGETSAYGPTRNPLDRERVPGGSSAGSTASVAADYVPLALGSDTGGSICLPSAFCNLVGFKPTYGSVSRYGLIAMGSSLDQIGTFTNNISDAESFFELISFYDKKDATSVPENIRESASAKTTAGHRKIGIPKILNDEKMRKAIDEKILEDFEIQINNFKTLGYEVVEVDIPNIDKALAIYYILCPAEVSSNMGRYDGVRYGLSRLGGNTVENFTNSRTAGLGDEVRRRILLGTYILSAGYFDAYYNKAVVAREILKMEFEKVFAEVDVVMTPTSSMLPWKFGEITNPLTMYLADLFTVPANIIGAPAISVPTTKKEEVNSENLPKSIHFIGNLFEDKKLFKIAKELEDFLKK